MIVSDLLFRDTKLKALDWTPFGSEGNGLRISFKNIRPRKNANPIWAKYWKELGDYDRQQQKQISDLNKKRLKLRIKAKKEEDWELFDILNLHNIWFYLGFFDAEFRNRPIPPTVMLIDPEPITIYMAMWGDVIE